MIVFPAPIILALSINEVKNKMGKRVVQSITYLPHFISWAVAGGLFYMFFSVSKGPVNAVIKAAGGAGINFMGSSVWYRWMVVLSSVWKEVGWGSIVYLAAITGVDEELYEAAAIDGANRWNCLRYITLPGISSVISVMLIMRVGAILSLNFDQTFAMLNDSVLKCVGETIEYYVYRVGMSSVNNYSLGTAIGLFKIIDRFVMVLVPTGHPKGYRKTGNMVVGGRKRKISAFTIVNTVLLALVTLLMRIRSGILS